MKTIKNLPKHRRPREKFIEKGPQGLTDAELMAIIIRTGIKGKSAIGLSREILAKYSLKELLKVKLADLKKIKGLGPTKAIQLLSAFEIANRAKENSTELALINPERIVNLLNSYRAKKKEYFITFYLNARHQLIKQLVVSVGHLTATLVHPREVFKPALIYSAVSVIVAHNHPSGDTTPSKDDLLLTDRLVEAGKLLDINLLDHIIVTTNSWISIKSLGYIK